MKTLFAKVSRKKNILCRGDIRNSYRSASSKACQSFSLAFSTPFGTLPPRVTELQSREILPAYLSPYVPNRGEDKLSSTLWRNREHFVRESKCTWNTKSKSFPGPNLIPSKPNSFSCRKPCKRSCFLFVAKASSRPSFPSLFRFRLKNPKFTDDLAKNFRKLKSLNRESWVI